MHPLVSLLTLAFLGAAPATPAEARDPFAERWAAAQKELERHRHGPRAIVPLSGLHDLEPEVPDLARLARVYAGLAQDRGALPEIRALSRFYLAGLERKRGNLQKAAAEVRRLAFLRQWQVAGPFDNEGKRGFDTAFPPEEVQDLSARYQGKVREVAWRAMPFEAQVMGLASLGAMLRPVREVTVYAMAVVESPREQRGQIWLGASGAVKLWVNGALALSDPAYHPARLDQLGVAVTLRRGPNRILLKLCHESGELGFYARLADAAGRPLSLPAVPLPPLPAPGRGGTERPERLEGVVGALERRAREAKGAEEAGSARRRAEAKPEHSAAEAGSARRRAEAKPEHSTQEARARLDLAVALWTRRSGDARERRAAEEARRAAALLPRSAEARLLAARLDDEDLNRRRGHLEAVLAADPGDAEALTDLASHEMQRGRPQRAVRLLEEAVAAAPAWAPARVALAQAREQAGLGARAALELSRLPRQFPASPGAALAAARGARRLDRLEEAALLLRKVLALRYDDEPARGTLTQLLVDKGDLEGALALMAASLRLDPSDLFLRLRHADLLAANGMSEQAEASYADAARLCPDEADVWERRGQARLRAGRQKDALADFQRALELRPQNPQLKELVRFLEPERERFEVPYLHDAQALFRQAPAPQKDEDAVVLGSLKVTRVFPSGLSATYVQQVVKVFTARGSEAWRHQSIAYVPGRQELRLDRARVWKPDGTVVESHLEVERSQSEPWYRLYYDARARVLTFPSLAPGDVLEVAWRLDDVAGENLLSDYFGDITFLADTARKLRADYVLLVPEGRKIHANAPALPGLVRTERTLPGAIAEHRWSAGEVARIDPEPGMPGWSEISPYVHVSTYADWNEVAAFYWGLVREQLQPSAAVREIAARIAAEVRARRPAGKGGKAAPADRETELQLVRAVHDFVVTSTRYVGLEFGIHGYKPYRVDQVLSRRFGDCKDKASLAHALLESLGIDSRLVLLRMRRLGRVPEKPASLAVFNHAILYVPRLDLWLDGTAAYSGTRELPAEDRGATVLVVNPGEPARFGYVPEARPEDDRTVTSMEISVAPDGSAAARGESWVSGERAPSYRRSYQAENERRAAFEHAMSRAFPGLKVEEVAVSDLSRIEEDVALRFRLSLARFAQREGDGLRFSPFGESQTYSQSYAPLSARRHDLLLGGPFENRFTYRFLLPAGWAPRELPDPASLDVPFGALEVRFRAEGGSLVAEGRIALKAGRVSAADYPAFRDFVSRVDRALSPTVRVGPPPAASASP